MKVPKFRSIRFRLTMWYALLLAIFFIFSSWLLYRGFKTSLLDTIDDTLLNAAMEVETAITDVSKTKWQERIRQVERSFVVNRLFIQLLELPEKAGDPLRLTIRSGVLAGNISLQELSKLLHLHPLKQKVFMDVNVGEDPGTAHPLRIILFPLTAPEEGHKYVVQVGISLKKLFNTLKYFQLFLLVSIPTLLSVSILGGYLILSKALGPVKWVVETARNISTEDLGLRIQTTNRKDEIGQLIVTFNQMISRLQRSVNQMKQFTGDASHDLKTPLTVIRGELELALRKNRNPQEYIKTIQTVQEEAEKLESIIDKLLFLSRIDEIQLQQSFQPVALDEILLQQFEKTQRLAADNGIAYVLDQLEPLEIKGDSILINRLLTNILDNAIKYTPRGGKVKISLSSDENGGTLTICDTGVGIPEESLPYVFDRFYRVDPSRSQRSTGSGLGLSIVKKIAEIHHIDVAIKRNPHQGITVTLNIPIKKQFPPKPETDS